MGKREGKALFEEVKQKAKRLSGKNHYICK